MVTLCIQKADGAGGCLGREVSNDLITSLCYVLTYVISGMLTWIHLEDFLVMGLLYTHNLSSIKNVRDKDQS